MKKLSVVLAAFVILAFAGCASSGGGTSEVTVTPYSVSLGAMAVVDMDGNPIGGTVKNPEPFSKQWDDLLILFPPFPADMNWPDYQRFTVTVNTYNENDELIPAGNGGVMLSLIYDISGDVRGPSDGPGRNTPAKEFGVGGTGTVHTERGSRVRLDRAPQAILLQNSVMNVRYIEVTEITFHNR